MITKRPKTKNWSANIMHRIDGNDNAAKPAKSMWEQHNDAIESYFSMKTTASNQ